MMKIRGEIGFDSFRRFMQLRLEEVLSSFCLERWVGIRAIQYNDTYTVLLLADLQ